MEQWFHLGDRHVVVEPTLDLERNDVACACTASPTWEGHTLLGKKILNS